MAEKSLTFRWKYIIVPVAAAAAAIIIALLYLLLPDELAYSFKTGMPDRFASRGVVLAWTLLPQFLFVLLAAGIVRAVAGFSRRFDSGGETGALPAKVLLIMGNMLSLPQLVLAFAMLDIFVYNSYQIHLLPIWVFALIIMALGGMFLGIFFVYSLKRVSQPNKEHK